jgi:hypothetical protein
LVGKALAEGQALIEHFVHVAGDVHALGHTRNDAGVTLAQRRKPGVQKLLGEVADFGGHGSPSLRPGRSLSRGEPQLALRRSQQPAAARSY